MSELKFGGRQVQQRGVTFGPLAKTATGQVFFASNRADSIDKTLVNMQNNEVRVAAYEAQGQGGTTYRDYSLVYKLDSQVYVHDAGNNNSVAYP